MNAVDRTIVADCGFGDAALPQSTAAAADGPNTVTTALLGVAAGAIGVWALDRLDWFLYDLEGPDSRARTQAARENGEAPAGVLVSRVEAATGRELSPDGHYAAELGTHYAIGIAPAVGYALLRDRLPVSGVTRGALYGAALWLLHDEVSNPLLGLSNRPEAYPWQNHARAFAAHILYGVTTEVVLNAAESRLQ